MPIMPDKIEDTSDSAGPRLRLTYTCMMCDKPCQIEVDSGKYTLFAEGMFVQEALPDLSASDREVLVSGSHAKCFEEAFAEEE